MSRRFKDLIREFAPERKPDAPLPESAPEPAAPALADGPTAVVVTEFLDAISALTALLDEETAAVAAGDLANLEVFAARKQAIAERLEGVVAQARSAPLTLTDDLRALLLDRIETLDRTIADNAAGLVAMRKAVLAINRSLLTALEKAASDGLYARCGQAVRPVELSASGLNAEL